MWGEEKNQGEENGAEGQHSGRYEFRAFRVMSNSLPLDVEREWYSLRDMREIFRISREAITAIFMDASKKGIPIRISVMDFENHPILKRKRPLIRIERKSLMAYLVCYCDVPEPPEADNSSWMEWLSPRDVERIYGISQEFLRFLLRDAEWNEMPIKIMRLPFANGSRSMKPKRYQVERRSLNAYLNFHVRTLI